MLPLNSHLLALHLLTALICISTATHHLYNIIVCLLHLHQLSLHACQEIFLIHILYLLKVAQIWYRYKLITLPLLWRAGGRGSSTACLLPR